MCALFLAQDIKTYGFDAILEPIIKDLKVLETDGIKVAMFKNPVRGSKSQEIILVYMEYLGLWNHSVLEIVVGFVLWRKVIFKLYSVNMKRVLFCERRTCILITAALYKKHPQLPHVYIGCKACVFVKHSTVFHTSDNHAVDIMHDILEGVAQFEVKLILEYILENYLTAKELSARIDSFNYGYTERRNRPQM